LVTRGQVRGGPQQVCGGPQAEGGNAIGQVTVLGVGNPIMADDGVGLELLTRLTAARPDGRIAYVEGGTGGMELVPVVADAGRLLVLDAVNGEVPGTVVRFSGDQLPRLLSARLSPHQVGLLDVFAAVRLLGREPEEVEVVGIVPGVVEMRLGLSDAVRAALSDAVAQAAAVLDGWLAEVVGEVVGVVGTLGSGGEVVGEARGLGSGGEVAEPGPDASEAGLEVVTLGAPEWAVRGPHGAGTSAGGCGEGS
jgi:hydrogenase maturation protease